METEMKYTREYLTHPVKTDGVNIIKVLVRPNDREMGNEYGIRGRLIGEFPGISLLKYIDITGLDLHPSCLKAIQRIISRNGGEIVCNTL